MSIWHGSNLELPTLSLCVTNRVSRQNEGEGEEEEEEEVESLQLSPKG